MTLLHDQVSGGQMALHLTVEYFGVQRNFLLTQCLQGAQVLWALFLTNTLCLFFTKCAALHYGHTSIQSCYVPEVLWFLQMHIKT